MDGRHEGEAALAAPLLEPDSLRLGEPSTAASTAHTRTASARTTRLLLFIHDSSSRTQVRILEDSGSDSTIPRCDHIEPRAALAPAERGCGAILTNFFAGARHLAIAYAVAVNRACVLLLAAAAALLLAPAACSAASADAAAAQKYIQANYALVQAGSSHLGAARTALRAVRSRIEGECPRAAAESPQNPDSTQLSNEIIGAMVTSAYRTDVPAGESFVRAASTLRWSNHRVTSTIQSYVSKLKVLIGLQPPNVCADVRAWVASGYQTLPASTVRFDAQFMPNWVAIGELPGSLAPYERPSEKTLLRRTTALEEELSEFEVGDGVETWGNIMNALVLNP